MNLDDLARGLAATDATTVLIDGRSGAGKSSLADQLHERWAASAVVRLDDIYPGWDGLAWAVEHVGTELLKPRAGGSPGRWRRWDWATGTADGWRTVAPRQRLIVEGVGVLTRPHRALADLAIWVETPDAVRKRRALQRDGDTYRPHWERWAAQEDDHIARHSPCSAADYVASETGHGRSGPTPTAWTFTSVEHDPV